MADALCGPSNALQNFQKHTSVDRTLQQDRLANRQSPNQGFRSSPGPNAGVLDPEFNAFQAGHSGLHQPDFYLHAHPQPLPQFQPQPAQAAPDWASDFQRLNIAAPQAPRFQQHVPQVSNAPASWHQDFMSQQQQQQPSHAQNTFPQWNAPSMSPGMAWGGSSFQQRAGFGMANQAPMSEVAMGKQRADEQVPAFDNAAFDKAFQDVQNELMQQAQDQGATQAPTQQQRQEDTQMLSETLRGEQEGPSALNRAQDYREESRPQEQQGPSALNLAQDYREETRLAEENDPVLLSIRDKRLPVYTAIKLRSAADLGQHDETLQWLQSLESQEQSGRLTEDVSEARWAVEALQKLSTRDTTSEIQLRAEKLITAVNQRLMSQYPLLSTRVPINHENIMEELEAAGYNTGQLQDEPQHQHQQPEQQKKEQQQPTRHDDDEMADTAGKLLERVADNTSEKFQNSQFLELMRRLRDREVKVEGDKMVEVSNTTPPSTAPPAPAPSTSIPDIDAGILNHSAQDFGMPMDSEMSLDERSDMAPPFSDPRTDEITEQFNWYGGANGNQYYPR
ncbi:hypothetical protein BU24DRAFT_458564 [Aaosphaeria arxii CBS 175.79]|uniref:Uncharacterized protein n=1 Tax=Aaosphaeria arxii CBS 175.79 TaxID=1450172 RepID=A0A6A5Y1Y0_9PLEO|nr:uncharacterized protein BU24DRAFT_458564 [Aaosphaeria arxii CBS 175.79]KAF2018830.1 hypothetical protein BU24DRAFT_458564 [Aaosphaeria arxii CBS 175.79]